MGGRENFRSLLRMLQMENGELVLCAPIDKK